MFKKISYFIIVSCFILISTKTFADYKEILKNKVDQSFERISQSYNSKQKKVIFPVLIKTLKKKKSDKFQRLINYMIFRLDNLLQKEIGNDIKEKIEKKTSNPYFLYKNINIKKFRETWLEWLNQSRNEVGLSNLSLDEKLNYSATQRAKVLSKKYNNGPSSINRNNVHKRKGSKSYYDYPVITKRMKQNGIVAKNVNGLTYTENIGYGILKCPNGDCTSKAIKSTKLSYKSLYIKEKKYNGVHYRGLTKKNFQKVGIGFVLDEKGYYRIVIHYATQVQ